MIYVDLGGLEGESVPAAYRIAGETVRATGGIKSLEPFRIPTPPVAVSGGFKGSFPSDTFASRRLKGWLAAEQRDVEVSCGSAGYSISLDSAARAFVSPDGGALKMAHAQRASDRCPFEGVLQPALILALALRGTYCFHAGAVETGGKAVLFLGRSGAGKSTIARYLGRSAGPGWALLSDDIVPVSVSAGRYFVLPRFPQLKLGHGQHRITERPARIPLEAVYIVDPRSAEAERRVRSEKVAAPDGLSAVVRHTVAAALYGPELLRRHLAFGTELVRDVSFHALHYPHEREVLAELPKLIDADLESAS